MSAFFASPEDVGFWLPGKEGKKLMKKGQKVAKKQSRVKDDEKAGKSREKKLAESYK